MTLLSGLVYVGRCGRKHSTPSLLDTTWEPKRVPLGLPAAESRKRDESLIRNCQALKRADSARDTRSKITGVWVGQQHWRSGADVRRIK